MSISASVSRTALSICRSQCPRPAILAWRLGRRFQSTTPDVSTPPSEPLAASLLKRFPNGPPAFAGGVASKDTLDPELIDVRTQTRQPRVMLGRVTSAGHMSKTVRVDVAVQEWHKYLRKFYKGTRHFLVHDPADSLRKGDLVSFSRLPVPKGENVTHVVREILVPFGEEIADRPPVPSIEDVKESYELMRAKKRERRELRRKAEQGNEEAVRRVKEEGIAVTDVEKGSGRGKRLIKKLERDVQKTTGR